MRITVDGKSHNVDDKQIERIMKNLPCDKETAIQIYIEDEGWVDNENTKIMEDGTEKAKEIMRTIHKAESQNSIDKRLNGTATRGTGKKKKDDKKIEILKGIAEYLTKQYENVIIENEGKIITFTVDGVNYKVDLSKPREKK